MFNMGGGEENGPEKYWGKQTHMFISQDHLRITKVGSSSTSETYLTTLSFLFFYRES